MNVATVLDEIERVAGDMVNLPQCEHAERVRDNVTIRVLIQEITDLGVKKSDFGPLNERLQHLKHSCRNLAGLGDERAPPDTQAFAEAKESLAAVRTQLGLEKE